MLIGVHEKNVCQLSIGEHNKSKFIEIFYSFHAMHLSKPFDIRVLLKITKTFKHSLQHQPTILLKNRRSFEKWKLSVVLLNVLSAICTYSLRCTLLNNKLSSPHKSLFHYTVSVCVCMCVWIYFEKLSTSKPKKLFVFGELMFSSFFSFISPLPISVVLLIPSLYLFKNKLNCCCCFLRFKVKKALENNNNNNNDNDDNRNKVQ